MSKIDEIFQKHGFSAYGRLIAGSKSFYRKRHPNDDVIFNANIFIKSKGKIWYGDLNLTQDAKNLQKVCDDLNEEMIIVTEMLGRFDAENRPYEEIYNDAHASFIPNANEYNVRVYKGFKSVLIGNTNIVTSMGVDWKKIKIN